MSTPHQPGVGARKVEPFDEHQPLCGVQGSMRRLVANREEVGLQVVRTCGVELAQAPFRVGEQVEDASVQGWPLQGFDPG